MHLVLKHPCSYSIKLHLTTERLLTQFIPKPLTLQCVTTDTEIKVPSAENAELSKLPTFMPGVSQNIQLCMLFLLPGILLF